MHKWFKENPNSNDVLSEDQVGENFVFAICNRYLGETFESANEAFLETPLAAYKYDSVSIGGQGVATKPWWKFW
jgi:hypothetical protein